MDGSITQLKHWIYGMQGLLLLIKYTYPDECVAPVHEGHLLTLTQHLTISLVKPDLQCGQPHNTTAVCQTRAPLKNVSRSMSP